MSGELFIGRTCAQQNRAKHNSQQQRREQSSVDGKRLTSGALRRLFLYTRHIAFSIYFWSSRSY